jgi:hypothetical protein
LCPSASGAGGGRGSLDLPDFPPPPIDGRREVAVVDLADDGDETVEGDTRARLTGYARLGWAVSAPPRWLCHSEAGKESPQAVRRRR